MAHKFWEFRNYSDGSDSADGSCAELRLYGDISDVSWHTDNVTPKQFAADLDALGSVDKIIVRINSGGGDVFAAQTIGNLLEQHPAQVVAQIDGLAASAATLITCHCNKVVAANDSIFMIHPVQIGIFDYVDEAKLNEYSTVLTALRESILDLYVKKTKQEKSLIAGWMDNTSWWTAEQAKANGFIDELNDSLTPSTMENRNGTLFVNHVDTHIAIAQAPLFVQNQCAARCVALATATPIATPVPVPAATYTNEQEEKHMEIRTLSDLRQAYPDLVNQLERDSENHVKAQSPIQTVADLRQRFPALVDQLEQDATKAERQRIQDIEEMSLPGSEEITTDAKFTNPINASEYAKKMIKHAKTQGATYLDQMQQDAEESGANAVENTPAPPRQNDTAAVTAQAKSQVAAFLNGRKGRKKEGEN